MRASRIRALCSFGCVFLISSCGSVATNETPKGDGVPYYLPRSLVELTFTPTQPPKEAGGTAAPPAISAKTVEIADPTQRYVASYVAIPFADDRLCILRIQTGLLQKIYFSSDDRLDDFLINVTQLITPGGDFAPTPNKIGLPGEPTAPVSMLIDPFDKTQIAAFNRLLGPYRISFPNLPPPTASTFTCPADSVCFATRISVPIVLSAGSRFVSQTKAEVVDTTNHGSLNIKRALMTERVTKVDLTDGVLTSIRIRKNSEALAVSEFPLRVTERLLAVPGNALTASLASYEEKKSYLEKQKQLAVTPMQSATVAGQPIDIATCLDAK